MRRRNFILKSSGGLFSACALGLHAGKATAKSGNKRITILHTNDVHSHIDPFPADHAKYPSQGGVENRAALISRLRAVDPELLLLDAGDIFQGTPYFNYYGGELEMKIMTRLGYDAGTIGNHDFDNGIDGLSRQMIHARFPLLNCNYDLKDTPLEGKIQPFKIFNRKGLKIGILGVGIDLSGLVDSRLTGKVRYGDAVQAANNTANLLRKSKGCDLIICLSHLGYRYDDSKVSDIVLARNSENIDIIIGGHTHTFLEKPVTEQNMSGKNVLVSQAGWAGLRLGIIEVEFEPGSGSGKKYFGDVFELKKTSRI